MKATVIVNFVDNKIRQAVSDKKSIPEIIEILKNRITLAKQPTPINPDSPETHFITSREEFNNIPKYRLLTLIKFRDKLHGLSDDIDIL